MPKLLSKKLDLFRDISSSGLTENKKKGKKNKCLGSIKFDAEKVSN